MVDRRITLKVSSLKSLLMAAYAPVTTTKDLLILIWHEDLVHERKVGQDEVLTRGICRVSLTADGCSRVW